MHQKSLTIKDTLLSSQASHPPEQPHPSQAGPPQGDPTNPTTPTPTPQNPQNQNQPAKPATIRPPPTKAATQSTLPDQPRPSKPEHHCRNNHQKIIQSFPAPSNKKGTRRSLNTHQTTVKSCPNNPTTRPPVLPPAHTHRASSREITLPQPHPPRKSRRRDTRSAHTMGQYCAWWVNTAVREPPLERQPPDGSGHRQIQRVSAPTVFFPRRTKAT